MKINIYCDELYPFYEVSEGGFLGDFSVEVTEEQLARWRTIAASFRDMQDEIHDLCKPISRGPLGGTSRGRFYPSPDEVVPDPALDALLLSQKIPRKP